MIRLKGSVEQSDETDSGKDAVDDCCAPRQEVRSAVLLVARKRVSRTLGVCHQVRARQLIGTKHELLWKN